METKFPTIKYDEKTKMNAKSVLVSFLIVVSVLFLVATVSAYASNSDFSINEVEVDGLEVDGNSVSVVAGETIRVRVEFTSYVNDSDVRVKVEIEGDKRDVEARSDLFDVEDGKDYKRVLVLEIPYDLKDELSDNIELNVEIDGKDSSIDDNFELRVQRPSFSADIKSVSVSQTVDAGETFPVDIVLKNVGYNDLDDVFVTAAIPALGIERTAYFGDLVALECDDDSDAVDNYGVAIDRKCNEDDEDTVSGRLFLEVPFGTEAGLYALEVSVENDDTTSSAVRQIAVENDFSAGNVISSTLSKRVAVNEDANYDILIVNPTNKLKVYRVVVDSSSDLSTGASQSVVAVPAGSSKTVTVTANAGTEGEYNFNVNVLSNEALVSSVALSLNTEGRSVTSPIVVLTVILVIVFLVLLVVLIVLLGKKPEKSEEFGESYY